MGPFRGQGGLHNSYKSEVKSRDPNGSWNRACTIAPLVLPSAQRVLEPVFEPLQRQYGLDDEQMAKAAALATAVLIHHFARHMDPAAGFGPAAFGFTEGARTAPLRLGSG
jgi:hypothetical protein